MIDGFTYCGSCNCSGTKNMKYEKDGYIVYHLPKRNIFHLKFNNNYILKNEPLSTLCDKLKSLGLVESGQCLSTN